MERVFYLGSNCYAVSFPYHMVTEMTLFKATRGTIIAKNALRFAPELKDEAGTKRMDSKDIKEVFPSQVSIAELGFKLKLKDYVLVQVI